jgi:hypothetical protein
MARIRTIKPSFFKSLTVTALPKATRLTWLGLWTYADDAGRGVDDARLIKAELWPLDDDYTAKKVEKDMQLLEANGSIRRYLVEGRRYFAVVEWRHQRIDKPTPSVLPGPPSNDAAPLPPKSGNPPGILREASVQEKEEGLGREVEVDPVNRSSSSLDGVGDAGAEEEDHHGQGPSPTDAGQVAQLVAERRWAKLSDDRRPPEGIRRERWLEVTAADVLAKSAGNIPNLLAGGMSVAAVVDLFEPPERPAVSAVPAPSRDQLPPAWDLNDDGLAVPRSVGA